MIYIYVYMSIYTYLCINMQVPYLLIYLNIRVAQLTCLQLRPNKVRTLNGLQGTAEVLSSVLGTSRLQCTLWRRYVLGKLHSGMS